MTVAAMEVRDRALKEGASQEEAQEVALEYLSPSEGMEDEGDPRSLKRPEMNRLRVWLNAIPRKRTVEISL